MKKLISLVILLIAFASATYSQTVQINKWIETPTAFVLKIIVNDIDSTTTGNTGEFDNTPILTRILHGNLSAYTGRDTVTAPYYWSNDVHIRVKVLQAVGTVDSLAYVYYQCADWSGNWTTVDTMKTNKANSIWTTVSYNDSHVLTSRGRFSFSGKDLTASGYNMVLEIEAVIPKTF